MTTKENLKNQKGLSLAEVLVALLILCIVAAPVMRIFITNARGNAQAARFTQGSLAVHSALEEMRAQDYMGAFTAQGISQRQDCSVVTTVRPFGVYDALAGGGTQYAQLIAWPDGLVFAGPDGQLLTLSLQNVSLQVSAASYTLTAGKLKYSGSRGAGALVLVILSTVTSPLQITCGSGVDAVLYAAGDIPTAVVAPSSQLLANLRNDAAPDTLAVLAQCTAIDGDGNTITSANEVLQLEIR